MSNLIHYAKQEGEAAERFQPCIEKRLGYTSTALIEHVTCPVCLQNAMTIQTQKTVIL